MKKLMMLTLAVLMLAASIAAPAMAEPKTRIVFADVGWDSIRFHNAVAGTVAEAVFGYSWEELSGSTPITHEGLMAGDIDAHMEVWTDNLPSYAQDLAEGKLKELSINFDDNYQGLYVPRYVIEGDAERGIEAVAPDLKTVEDLKRYADIFPDPESPGMGRIFGGIPGWEVTEILRRKVELYGLTEMYNYVLPGSDAAMSAAIVSAWDRGKPIVTYYWEPT
ncbi:MAG: glycine betaine ABC transporter substrate-binding protein, partial [Christensenellaceae bacterium]|nr:glycine betaine ABC transporter substrate-binding protein [Christensenellaceae bacterium]